MSVGLREYHRKRDFGRTSEPRGRPDARSSGDTFVVQKHDARSLHYDFRLELDGVLKSWAVPKGPSLDPAEKRLAVQTEDHPLDYAGFEGVIPEGEYGAGPVIVWDRGRWKPEGDPRRGLAAGKLKFQLEGDKLGGGWTLVRLRGRASRDDKANWLLIKARDDVARPSREYDISRERPESVLSEKDRTREPVRRGRASRKSVRETPVPQPSRTKSEPASAETSIAGVRLTHPNRILYPAQGVTKSALARYYESIADWMLPELRGRPTTLVRCPEGLRKECFYQKHVPAGAPPALRRVAIQEKKKVAEYLVVDDLAGLVSLVQIGILEVHTWNSRADTLEEPDRLVFDLDPAPGLSFSRVVAAAVKVRERLRASGLESFVKTTGGKGLHVVVPLSRGASWEACTSFSRALADSIVKDEPRAYTANMSKAARTGKVFIDYLRNLRGATSVAAYSTRAREGAAVATPLAWEELHGGLQPASFSISSLPRRLAALPSDPWQAYGRTRQSLPE